MPRHTIYSEEVQEILGRIPGWVIRWGIVVLFCLFLLIMGITYLVRYPETISAPIVLTTLNPPADLIARSSNKIEHILVKDGDSVAKDEVIAVLYNTGDYRSVLKLENTLLRNGDRWELYFSGDFLNEDCSLGELQSYYIQFVKQCLLFDHYLQTDFTVQKQKLIEDNIAKTQQTIRSQAQQMSLLKEDMAFENKNLARDSLLLHSNALTPAEYERSQQSVLQKRISMITQNTALTSTESSLINMKQQLLELKIQRDNEILNYRVQLSEAREQLLTQIGLWKEKYMLQSPIDGRVTFTKYWSNNQNVVSGERLASVVPNDSLQVIGKMYIPSPRVRQSENRTDRQRQVERIPLYGIRDTERKDQLAVFHSRNRRVRRRSRVQQRTGFELQHPDQIHSANGRNGRHHHQRSASSGTLSQSAQIRY